MISDFDLLIGCTVVENNLTMVTENFQEFNRIAGIENWVKR
jgi:tRNA(fMet)-specific endonuclease VapC